MFNSFPTKYGTLYFGPLPDPATLEILRLKGVTVIWNLTAELKNIAKEEKAIFETILESNIRDFDVPDFKEDFVKTVNHVCDLLIDNKKVFVHCLGGHGRTGMALASVAMKLNGATVTEALTLAHNHCNGPETESQIDFIRKLLD